ncbi:MAG: cupin domain-containing protein [Chloroflexia bacterium]|nr:cupin domain-containing protein [Chloroflexia bacterium]
MGTRIVHDAAPVARAPSGRPLRHLVGNWIGAGLYVGEQWLLPGEAVPLHIHPVEEVLVFLGGEGVAILGEKEVAVGVGITLHIPPGEPHGFRNTGAGELRLLVIFPMPEFAETGLV